MTSKKLMLAAITLLLLLGFSNISVAGVSVNVRIPLPPPLFFPAPPPVVVIPGTYAYFCPDAKEDIFFYQGYWYRPYEGRWYRATVYSGPWVYIVPERVPVVLISLPPDFRAREYRHIPYVELHRNWRTWERDRYWERHGWERNDRNEERHNERHNGPAPRFGEERRHFDGDRGRR
jgi:hypothetical protein